MTDALATPGSDAATVAARAPVRGRGTQASTLDLRNPLVSRFLGTSEHALAREAPLNAHITALILISSIPLREVKV